MDIMKRENGFFHYMNGKRVKAYYPKRDYWVMIFFEDSPIDMDFCEKVWCPSADELRRVADMLDESDRKTFDILGHGWGSERTYMRLEELL